MCGISGYYSPQSKITSPDLERMTNSLSHRGPDAAGYFYSASNQTGLGHRRLSIIDLSTAANQPMHSADGRYVIVYNGEVYNYREIAETLKIEAKTTSDTEIILEAFAKKGVEAVPLFNGMFAIAIYDKVENSLFLIRDRLGIKPLYYFHDDSELAFSSEINSLVKADYVKSKIEIFKPAVYQFLYSGYIPEPHTIYRQINKLPAGAYAIIKEGEIKIEHYWKPEDKIEKQVASDFTSAKNQLKELLTSSVRYRMISDVPMGTFLSGGIDSSTVTAMAQSLSNQPINTFSIGFKEAKFDESQYALAVSKHLGTRHHEFTVTEQDALDLVDKMMTAYGEPYADSSAIPTMLVSKLARQHVTVTLSGDGGDELFMGYGAYTWAARLNNPFIQLFRKPIQLTLAQMGNRYKRASELFNYSDSTRIKSHIFSQEQYFFSERELQSVLTEPYRSGLLFQETFSRLNRPLSAAEQQALFDIKYYLKDDLLTKVDIASMQFSLEARTPFLDYRIVEFALNLDEKWKRHGGVAKYLLKQVLYDYVPAHLFDRPKWGFSIPLGKWLKTDLHYLMEDYLNPSALEEAGIVKLNEVSALIKRFERGEDFLYNRIWCLIIVHKWMREHGG